MGTSSINGPFSMAMLNNQRVLEFISCRCNPQFRIVPMFPSFGPNIGGLRYSSTHMVLTKWYPQ